MNIFTKSVAAVLLTAGMAHAHEYKAGDISIVHPTAFETAQSASVGGGYMTITNNGTAPDRLIAVRVAEIPRIELHLSETDENGVARMIKQDGIPLPVGEAVMLKPGGLHVMFMGLNGDPFEVGEEINATLVFETAGEVDVVFNVEARSADNHSGMDHSGHKMSE
jgi:copper(I)-binding protein